MTQAILVTGATGYIGSHICKYLKHAGYAVVGVDLVRREHTLKHMDKFIQADYMSIECVQFLAEHAGIASVVHCAGTSLVGPSIADPSEYYINNVSKTIMFLDVLRTLPNQPSIVFSSSAAVYGAPDVDVIYENQPLAPISPYGQSKAMIEQVLTDYCRAYGMNAISLRYFNACGADTQDADLGQPAEATHIVARLLESVKQDWKFTLNGTDYNTPDGTCVRDYVHVNDLARAHMMAVQYMDAFVEGHHEVINLGSGQGYSNQEIITAVQEFVGPVEVVAGPRRSGDPDRLVAGTVKASTMLGWRPEHSDLKTIVKSAWAWYNN
jgi:UDP-glucose-4-epimerase GalE